MTASLSRPRSWSRRCAGLLLAVAAVLLLTVAPAAAHAVLEESAPASGAVLASAPATVTLRFDESVTTVPTSLRVFGPSGQRVDDGALARPGGDSTRVSVGLKGSLPDGTYLVSWRVVSADSHPVSGAYSFSVGAASATPPALAEPTERNDPTLTVLLGLGRWLGYLGAAVLAGGVLFLLRCWPPGWSDAIARRLLLGGAGAVLVGAVIGVLLKGPYDAALGLSAVAHRDLLGEVLGSTYGRGVVARGCAALAALLLLLAARGRPSRLWGIALGAVLAGLLATFGATGHAIAADQRALRLLADFVHVAAMSAWLGGLTLLAVVLLTRRGDAGVAATVAARFSPVAAISVAALVVTGVYQGWRQVGSWAALDGTTYGRELAVKVALVAAALAAAAVSRWWVSSSRRHQQPDTYPIRVGVASEAALGVVVLALTSALVATQPARTAYHPSVAANLTLGPDTVQVSAVPAGDRSMEVHLYVFDRDGQPTQPAELTADLGLAAKQIGPLPVELQQAGVGHELATITVPTRGDWTLTVRLRITDVDAYGDVVTLPIR